jgi:hypothetical protein
MEGLLLNTTAFRLFGIGNYIPYQYVMPFDAQPANGIELFLPYDSNINNNKIKGITTVTADVIDQTQLAYKGIVYNLPTAAQLADFAAYFKFVDDMILEGFPLNTLAQATNGRQANVLATNTRIDTEKNSYLVKRGATVMPALPWAICFTFYFENNG